MQTGDHDLVADLSRCAADGGVVTREVDRRYIATGTLRRVIATCVPLTPGVVVLHTEDVTERRRAEGAARNSEARVRALLDSHPDIIVRVTRDGRYLDMHASEENSRYLPVPSEQFIGRNVRDFFDSDFVQQHERHRHRALATEKLQLWEYSRPVDGVNRYLEARFVKAGDNEVLVSVRDITERVGLQREVIASADRERARVGHDLHDGLAQLLTGVKFLLQSLREKLIAEGSRHGEDVERATELVGRALSDAGELARGLSPVPKGARLDDVLQRLAAQSQRLFDVRCRVAAGELPSSLSETSATHLYRIAQEAITNAVKHGKATRIDVTCAVANRALRLTIADNGVGVSEAWSEDRGMGLHIMRYRARSIGGELTMSNVPGGGALVVCSCPFPGP